MGGEKGAYVRGLDGHDEHDPTSCDDIEESYDIANTDDVENNKAVASLLEVVHYDCLMLKS